MSQPQKPKPGKLVIGLFMKDKGLMRPVVEGLTQKFGPVDVVGPWFPFDLTDYYEPEMGKPLFRRVLAFERLIEQKDLVNIKIETNHLEQQHLQNRNRLVNIDPGYLLPERFVLATAKNYTHRIYIGKGIYADLTLIYSNGSFQALPWTYPDYKQKNMLTVLQRIRNKYLVDLKTLQSRLVGTVPP